MDQTNGIPDRRPGDDADDVEILEVVGVEEGTEPSVRPPRCVESQPELGGRDEPAEFVLDLDDGEPGLEGEPTPEAAGHEAEEERLRVLRLRADYDNLRKRFDRERQELERQANLSLVERLLPVLDNLERALAVDGAAATDGALREGLVLIHRQLTEQLRREGLQPISAIGLPFDPNLHDAVATEGGRAEPANTVVEEFQKGYLFQDRVLRPAMVKVSTGSGNPPGDV